MDTKYSRRFNGKKLISFLFKFELDAVDRSCGEI